MTSTSKDKPIKRLRLSQVCLSCKRRKVKCDKIRPKCSNCIKFGVVHCEYNEVKWINTNSDYKQSMMRNEIDMLKSKLESYRRLDSTLEPENTDFFIDFYKHPNGELQDGISKPLDFISCLRRDPYISFFTCYMTLTKKFNFKIKTPDDHMNQWMIFLDIDNEDSSLANTYKILENDRNEILAYIDDDARNIEDVRKRIIEILPEKHIINEYLNYFFKYIHPLRPFLNEAEFRLKLDHYSISKTITESNQIFLATLSVVLRYTYICIQLMKRKQMQDINLTLLVNNPIKVEFINLSKRILSSYNLSKPVSFEIFQLLLFLNVYFEDCPEDGNAVAIDQSQNLYGLILQIALNLGLSRDTNNDLNRMIWLNLSSTNAFNCILLGNSSILPDPTSSDVTSVEGKGVLDSAMNKEFEKEINLNRIYIEISRLTNNLKQHASYSKLSKLLNESSNYINETYNLNSLEPLEHYTPGSQDYSANVLKNTKIISKQLIHISLQIQIYATICNYSESKLHINIELFKKNYLKFLKASLRFRDLFAAFANEKFDKFLDDVQYFEILPIFQKSLQRNSIFSLYSSLRLYHALEVKEDDLLKRFLRAISISDEVLLGFYKECHSNRYYNSMRLFSSAKYSTAALKRYRFRALAKVIGYLEQVKETHSNYKDNIIFNFYQEWIPSDQDDSIININNVNFFTQGIEPEFVKECLLIFENNFVYFPEFPSLLKQRSNNLDILSVNNNTAIKEAMEKTQFEIESPYTIGEQKLELDPDQVEHDLALFNHIFKDLETFGDFDTFFKGI